MIACSVVDLPAPFGPIRPTISPSLEPQRQAAHGRRPRRTAPRRRRARASTARHRRLAEVRGGDVEVRAHLGGRPLGQRPALVEHLDPVADLHHERHVVVDQQHARLVLVAHRADDGGELGHLALGEPGGRLVEEQEARLASRAPARRRASARRRGRGCRPAAPRTARARAARAACAARRRASRGPGARAERRDLDVLADARATRTTGECWNVRARPARPRRCGLQRVTSLPAELDRAGRSGSRSPSARSRASSCPRRSGRSARRPRGGGARASRRGARGRPGSGVRRRWPGERLRATGRSVRKSSPSPSGSWPPTWSSTCARTSLCCSAPS